MNALNWTAALLENGRNFFRTTRPKGAEAAASVSKSCEMNGKVYPRGAEIMHGALIRRCVDGQWQERVNPFITVGP